MKEMLMHLVQAPRELHGEAGFLVGRVALVVLILAIIVVAAVIAFIVPGS